MTPPTRPVAVKVCGLTTAEDARWAAACGADALGFIFVPGSKREVSPAFTAGVADALPPFCWRVGVFANQPVESVLTLARQGRLDAVQLHGDEPDDVVAAVAGHFPVLRALLADDPHLHERMKRTAPHVRAFVIDSGSGTGRTFDWHRLLEMPTLRPTIVAGGLDGSNVGDLFRVFRPAGVDASSRLESAPRLKNPALVAAFVAAGRENPPQNL
ncbi:MAG: phosphoribosylanthranilate isomerase [Candidatus Sericytochromatia bacterium]|nr:phosphoribosylanthranilate isomerase [Candidatus Sericytochromatia bacterium]